MRYNCTTASIVKVTQYKIGREILQSRIYGKKQSLVELEFD